MNTGTIIGIVGGIIGVILLNGVYNSVSLKKTIKASPKIIKILNSNSIKSSDGPFFDVSFGGKRKNKTKKI